VTLSVGLSAMLIAVSESSLPRDRGKKLLAFARGGIPKYAIINLAQRRIEVYTDPRPDGYGLCTPHSEGQAIPVILDGTGYFRVETVSNQQQYTMLGVRAGDYFVYAAGRALGVPPPTRFGAGYTKAVPCGLSVDCTDHAPITVHVSARATTTGVDPTDWYAGPDTFPLIPRATMPASSPSPSPTTFATAEDAAAFLAESRLQARHVGAQSDCPLNVGCFWFTDKGTGHNAAYFLTVAGSNQDPLNCGVYVIDDQTTWRTLDVRCTSNSTTLPAVGATGHVQLGMAKPAACAATRRRVGTRASSAVSATARRSLSMTRPTTYRHRLRPAATRLRPRTSGGIWRAMDGWSTRTYTPARRIAR